MPSESYHLEISLVHTSGRITVISKNIIKQIIAKARIVLRRLEDGKAYFALDIYYSLDSGNPMHIAIRNICAVPIENEKGFIALTANGTIELDESIDTVVHEINLTE